MGMLHCLNLFNIKANYLTANADVDKLDTGTGINDLAESLFEMSRNVFDTKDINLIRELNCFRTHIDYFSARKLSKKQQPLPICQILKLDSGPERANFKKPILLRNDLYGRIVQKMSSIFDVKPNLTTKKHLIGFSGAVDQFLINFWGGSKHINKSLFTNAVSKYDEGM